MEIFVMSVYAGIQAGVLVGRVLFFVIIINSASDYQ